MHRVSQELFLICVAAVGGALGFHGLQVWPILALKLRDLLLNALSIFEIHFQTVVLVSTLLRFVSNLNRAGLHVLRCAAGCGFGLFLCSGSEYFTQNSYFVAFRSHTGYIVN